MRFFRSSLLAIGLHLSSSAIASAQQPTGPDSAALASLLEQDRRLATVAERILAANAPLCRRLMPLTGLILHSADQYNAAYRPDFSNGPLTIAAILPGSPAASAGLVMGDGIVGISDQAVAGLPSPEDAPIRDAAFAAIADTDPAAGIHLTISRNGELINLTLSAPAGCRALVEIKADNGSDARSDGRVIQIDHGLAASASDAELAVIFAHELGHVVLEHRRRLEEAGIVKGPLGEFGRNQQMNRQAEVEADRISVHLLANAGYDPAIAPAFWRSHTGGRVGGGLLRRSSTYPTPEERARLIEREIADYLGSAPGPSWPGHLLARRD